MVTLPAGLTLDAINRQLAQLDDAKRQIDTAERAGIDMKDRKEQLRQAREKALALKNAYFPGQ